MLNQRRQRRIRPRQSRTDANCHGYKRKWNGSLHGRNQSWSPNAELERLQRLARLCASSMVGDFAHSKHGHREHELELLGIGAFPR